MKFTLLTPIVITATAIVSSTATFFITKSVTSNSESQVVSYLKEKETKEKAEMRKIVEADEIASKRLNEAWRQVDERMKNPN